MMHAILFNRDGHDDFVMVVTCCPGHINVWTIPVSYRSNHETPTRQTIHHADEMKVTAIVRQNSTIIVACAHTIYMFQLNRNTFDDEISVEFVVTALCDVGSNMLFIGSECGDLYLLDLTNRDLHHIQRYCPLSKYPKPPVQQIMILKETKDSAIVAVQTTRSIVVVETTPSCDNDVVRATTEEKDNITAFSVDPDGSVVYALGQTLKKVRYRRDWHQSSHTYRSSESFV